MSKDQYSTIDNYVDIVELWITNFLPFTNELKRIRYHLSVIDKENVTVILLLLIHKQIHT